jgi:hypothetical protein
VSERLGEQMQHIGQGTSLHPSMRQAEDLMNCTQRIFRYGKRGVQICYLSACHQSVARTIGFRRISFENFLDKMGTGNFFNEVHIMHDKHSHTSRKHILG